jgi:hypothetical protein
MSGKEAVRALRERGLQQPPTDFGPALRTIAFALVAFVVGGGAVFGGVKLFAGGGGPGLTPPSAPAPAASVEQVALVTETPLWTPADERTCQMAFDSAAQAERDVQKKAMEEGQIMATGGSGSVAPMGAQVRCMATTKPERLCDPEQRAVFVAAVKAYVEQSIFIGAIAEATDFSMNVYIPAVAAASGTKSTEHEFGIGIVNDMTKSVGERMVASHKKVAATLRDLVERGYVREDDFGSFMGFGVPLMIKNMLKGVEPGPSICG